MKRAVAIASLIAAASLGLAGCSSSSDKTPESSEQSAASVSEESTTDTAATTEDEKDDSTASEEITLEQSCLALATTMDETGQKIAEIGTQTDKTAPQLALETQTALATSLEEFSKTDIDPELAAAAAKVGADGMEVAAQIQRVLVDGDGVEDDAFVAAYEAFAASNDELLNVCSGSN